MDKTAAELSQYRYKQAQQCFGTRKQGFFQALWGVCVFQKRIH